MPFCSLFFGIPLGLSGLTTSRCGEMVSAAPALKALGLRQSLGADKAQRCGSTSREAFLAYRWNILLGSSCICFSHRCLYTQALWDVPNQNVLFSSDTLKFCTFFPLLSKGTEKFESVRKLLGAILKSGSSKLGRSHNFACIHIPNSWCFVMLGMNVFRLKTLLTISFEFGG